MNTQNTVFVAPVATVTAETAATETKKTSPAREGRAVVEVTVVEASKAEAPVETWTCNVTGEDRPIDKMLVPKLGEIDKEVGRRTTEEDLRKRAVSAKGAMKKGLDREELMFLDVALELVRKDDEKAAKARQAEEARVAKAKELAAFRATVFIGKPQILHGKTYFRCVQGKECTHAKLKGTAFVGSEDVMQAPSLEDMQAMNWNNRRGRMVTVNQFSNLYVLCPECAKELIESPQSAKSAQQEIDQDLADNGEAHEAEADRIALVTSYIDAADQFVPKTPRGKRSMKGGNKRHTVN